MTYYSMTLDRWVARHLKRRDLVKRARRLAVLRALLDGCVDLIDIAREADMTMPRTHTVLLDLAHEGLVQQPVLDALHRDQWELV